MTSEFLSSFYVTLLYQKQPTARSW